MPHSPLLRSLLRSVQRDFGSDWPRITRRTFLSGFAATGLSWRVSARNHPRIVIAGAGLAGLTCAYRLKQLGISSELYEGSARPGGRCLTIRNHFEQGQIAEAGGSDIDHDHEAIRNLCQELGLELINLSEAEPPNTTPLYYFDGRPYRSEQASEDLKAIYPALQREASAAQMPVTWRSHSQRARELDHMPMQTWLRENVPGGASSRLGRLLQTAMGLEYGEDSNRLSALNLISLLSPSRPGELWTSPSYRVRGGNDRIVSALAQRTASDIRYEHMLRGIVRNRDRRYELTFGTPAGTTVVSADCVILAIPFTILRRIDYSRAGFRTLKDRAIREQGMGANSKLHLQFLQRQWTRSGCNGLIYSDAGYLALDVTLGQPGEQGILMYFTGGQVARRGAVTPSRALSSLNPAMPEMASLWNRKSHLQHWPLSPFARGSYSLWRPGQQTAFAGVEAEPEGQCFFCGEHTSLESQGYLNGAVESGERVAREVVAALA